MGRLALVGLPLSQVHPATETAGSALCAVPSPTPRVRKQRIRCGSVRSRSHATELLRQLTSRAHRCLLACRHAWVGCCRPSRTAARRVCASGRYRSRVPTGLDPRVWSNSVTKRRAQSGLKRVPSHAGDAAPCKTPIRASSPRFRRTVRAFSPQHGHFRLACQPDRR